MTTLTFSDLMPYLTYPADNEIQSLADQIMNELTHSDSQSFSLLCPDKHYEQRPSAKAPPTPYVSPLSQNDVMNRSEQESLSDDLGLKALLLSVDSMLLDIEFDYSCLTELDEQLLLRPFHSFAEICWKEAVCDGVESRYSPHACCEEYIGEDDTLTFASDTEESDSMYSHSGSLTKTPDGQLTPRSPSSISKWKVHFAERPLVQEDDRSYLVIDHPLLFRPPPPDHSIHFFPIPAAALRRGKSAEKANNGFEKITDFCSKLPHRLMKVSF